MPVNAFMTASSWMGLAVEATRGVPLTPTVYLPVESPAVTEAVAWLEDKGFRGSPVVDYGNVPEVRHAEYDVKGNVFLDTFPYLLRSVLGSTDTYTAAPSSTTLSAAAVVGANSVSTAVSIPAGSLVSIGSGTTVETHVTGTPTGAGPYTIPLNQPLLNAQPSGAAVTGLNSHQVGLLNSPTAGNQPPSLTIVDYDGTGARQMAAAQGDSLNLTFGAGAAFAWAAKFIGNPTSAITAPTTSFSTEVFVPGYSVNATVAGAPIATVVSGEVDMKRSTAAIQTADGTQTPFQNFAGPLDVTGKLTLVVVTGDSTLVAGTSYLKQVVDLLFTEPISGHGLDLRMSQVQYDSPKVNRGKAYVEIDTQFKAEANATDAVSGGYAPMRTTTGNAKASSY